MWPCLSSGGEAAVQEAAAMSGESLSVCMFTNLFRPVVSGSSTQSATLSRELVRRGQKPFVITARVDPDTPEYEEVDGVPIYRLPCIRLPKMPISLNFPWFSITFTPGNQRRIAEILHRHKPDVIHLHNHMLDMAFSAVRMSRQFHLPLLVTIHTMIHHTTPIYNAVLYPADRILLRCLVTDKADVLLCPDINIEGDVHEAFRTTSTEIVPYGISFAGEPTQDQIERIEATHNLASKRVILSLGHVHDVRCRRDEVRAMPEILKAFPDAVLVIVGAETTDIPRKLAGELGVTDKVIFAGHVAHTDVPAYLALADLEVHLFYQDSQDKQSLGIASLEAMAAGNVIVNAANKDSYGRDLLKHGENIIFVDRDQPRLLARAIVDLLGDEEKRKSIGAAAAKTIREHFSWERVCEKTLAVYRDTMETRKGDR